MTKIKSIKQLRAEKKRVALHLQELEQKMQHNWKELKEAINPVNLAAGAFNDALKSNTQKNNEDNGLLKGILTFGATILAKKLATKTGEKLGKMFHKN